MNEISIYIHIPFCDHKCIYCDFYSIIRYDNIPNFFSQLHREIESCAVDFSRVYSIKTIYFGGGTPSFVETKYINETIEILQKNFTFCEKVEITLETNPGTVDTSKLNELKLAGINRLSVGVQSFDESELKFLTRIHDPKTAIDTIENAASAGFYDINLDLIFNLPGQTKTIWRKNLETAIKLPITHLSTYSLILERGTILNKMVLDGKVKMQDDDYDADLYEFTIEYLLKNNFNQYEVSNFCLNGYECKHNLAYWQHKEYLGFGTSAHSFVGGRRWWNYSSAKMYIESMKSNNNAVASEEVLTKKELCEEYVMLHLRSKGLDLIELESEYGTKWISDNSDYLDLLLKKGFITRTDNFIKFTPRGYAICDEILSNLK